MAFSSELSTFEENHPYIFASYRHIKALKLMQRHSSQLDFVMDIFLGDIS